MSSAMTPDPAILPSVVRPGRSWVLLALVSCAAGLPLHGGNAEELAVADLGLEPLLVSCAAVLPLHHDDRVSGEVRRDGETMPDWNPDRDLDTRIPGQWASKAMDEDRARREAVAGGKDLRGRVTKVAAAVRAQLDGAKNQVPLIPRSPLGTRGAATAHPQVRGKSGAGAPALVGLDVRLAREPMALVEQARHVRGRRSDPELRLPAPGPGVRTLDTAPLELISDTQALATALANLRAARVRGKETLLERRRAPARLHVR